MSILSEIKAKFASLIKLFKPIKNIKEMKKISDYYNDLSKKPPKINKKNS